MSFDLCGEVWKLDLDTTTAYVLMAVCDSASDETWSTYASEQFLHWKTRRSLATIYRVLDNLEAKEIISRQEDERGRRHIFVHLDKAPRKEPWVLPRRGRPRKSSHDEKDLYTKKTRKSSHHEKKPLTMRKTSSPQENFSHAEKVDPVNNGHSPQAATALAQSGGAAIQVVNPITDPGRGSSAPSLDVVSSARGRRRADPPPVAAAPSQGVTAYPRLWREVVELLVSSQRISQAERTNWFGSQALYEYEPGVYVLLARTSMQAEMLTQRFSDRILSALSERTGKACELDIEVQP